MHQRCRATVNTVGDVVGVESHRRLGTEHTFDSRSPTLERRFLGEVVAHLPKAVTVFVGVEA